MFKGLEPATVYNVEEINRFDGSKGEVKSYSGDYLMTIGLPMLGGTKLTSKVYKLSAQ